MAAPYGMTRLLGAFRRFEHAVFQWMGLHPPPGFQAELVYDIQPVENHVNNQQSSTKSILQDIFDSILLAVPKSRRTAEKNRTRKMSMKGHYEYAVPKNNIIACLECGNWHEKETICGHCYQTVKTETEEMQKAMGLDALKYDAPRSEVVFLYDGEEQERPKYNGKYIVEMKKQRPEWFSKNLMTKAHNSK
ncbi:39S ribosomal protein L32, mitochondrial [Patella vulgata]|uniref:39S ribosomal protein L32, mitochondrial n=1 Tax=Patella vulgata TaxID=6465 RepID=UPI0021809A94|nr:39S ribosomal protein L32, mitochondrial [Patella vulgata]